MQFKVICLKRNSFEVFNLTDVMSNKYNIHIGRAGILNLISQREQGVLLNQLYKNNVTNVKVNQLPKFSERPTIYTDADDGFYWRFLRNGSRGDLIGVGWDCNGAIRRRHSSVCVFQFLTHSTLSEKTRHNLVGKDASIDTLPFINEISKNYNILPDLLITDTADLSFRNQKPLLIVGTFKSGGNAAILTSYHCEYVHQEYEWRVDDHIFCCASEINSENFVLGCTLGFYTSKNLKLSKKYCLEENVIAVEFNDDGNLLFISGHKNGIQLFDMRENLERFRSNSPPYIKEPALNDSSLIANRMKLLTDQVTLIVSGKTGYISKIDLRMRKPVFQYSEHRTFQSCRPLNIDEDLDLLCAVGNDNCCRIWSLSSGKLHWTNKIAATNYRGGPLTAHACIVSSERRWFIAVIQNDTVTPIVPDEAEMVAFQPESAVPSG
ncbi:hypothetical protein AVEN_31987-1 [Araneus ventricosus]|uniref:Uncharacterized protein n=1 Tax=Araneus ventricosus TaxID=182803 RepID=A0A4Y2UFE7_ARAVE|nr:hypothetical protein AVEN_137885-1 [Araneus ventricosus]GBO11765.1 hypothetical protein AVEN_19163-1 [Araneus ventricosus]GBO11770.1 hypothetical protein AVEN_34293-1 [Araneus ventricosus]GBO12101.1 hypothetical protein AVEN_31987-1 [Araneus ventricosus]